MTDALDAVLVTGATGTIGRELVGHLLRATDTRVYVLLHRRGRGLDPAALLADSFDLPPEPRYLTRLRPLDGDITQPELGLDAATTAALWRELTGVVHAAATTRFDLPLAEARRVNVDGTAAVLRLAAGCARLERVGFLSTAFVAGRRTGLVLEAEREHDAGFANTYEQSKYEAERLVEASGLPVATYRLATVLGDARTGRVRHFTAPHFALRTLYLGLAAMLPGAPETRADLIPGDVASAVVGRLFVERFEPGGVYHVTAPEGTAFTLGEVIEESYAALAELDPAWARRGYPRPVLAPLEAFELFLQAAEQADNPLLRGVLRGLAHFACQMAYPKTFDRTRLRGLIPEYDVLVPDPRSYYRAVVRYCLETNWGANDADGQPDGGAGGGGRALRAGARAARPGA